MLVAILCLVGVGLIWAAIGCIQSRVAGQGESIVSFYAAGFTLAGGLAWGLMPDWQEAPLRATPMFAAVVIWIGLSGIANGAGKAMMIAAMRHGHKGVTLAMAQATMLVPFLGTVILWSERPTPGVWCGMLLALAGVVMLALYRSGDDKKVDSAWMPLALGAFAIMGLGRTCFLVPSHSAKDAVELSLRTPVALSAAAFVHITLMIVKKTRYDRKLLSYSIAFALLAVCGYELSFKAADILQKLDRSGLTFPVSVSVCIVAFGLYSRLVLKEHFNRRTLVGMALTTAGLLMMVT